MEWGKRRPHRWLSSSRTIPTLQSGDHDPFALNADLFANGHRPKVSLKIYNVLAAAGRGANSSRHG